MSNNCQTRSNSFLAELSKRHFTIPKEQCGCLLLLRKIPAPYNSGIWVKNSAISPNVFQQVCENCIFCVQMNIFDEKNFFVDFIKLNPCLGYELKFFGIWAKKFRRGCKNFILQVWRKHLRKKVFLNVHSFIISFGLFKEIFDPSSAIRSNVVIYALYVSKRMFRARIFPWNFYDFVCSSGLWAEKCCSCDKKVSADLPKL